LAAALAALYFRLRRRASTLKDSSSDGDAVTPETQTEAQPIAAPDVDDATHPMPPVMLDRDQTAQHVQMPSVLNENAVVKERRTNPADVLKQAIEREPDRRDLHMKLLELYYSAAATNRKAFLEVVQTLARERGHLQAEQWDKITHMGRQIASDNPLFWEESTADDDLADCA
jgi:Tfp pilus assembly protein FimV